MSLDELFDCVSRWCGIDVLHCASVKEMLNPHLPLTETVLVAAQLVSSIEHKEPVHSQHGLTL